MKAIVLSAILSGFRSRKDKSLGFSVSTPELSVPEKVALMELEAINVRLLIEPTDYATDGKVEVKGEHEVKTPSQRLRNVIYAWFSYEKEAGKIAKDSLFEPWYAQKMESLIEFVKKKLPQDT